MVEKYSPTIRKEKNFKIEGTDYESKIDSLINEDGIIKMRLNEDVIIQRVSNQLYKSSYSAFRELYNNCCYHGVIDSKSYVKVSLDTFSRKFVIQDFNSNGISGDVFNEILTELGTSSNTNRSKGGKFGLGFNAYPLLSDVVILETNCVNGDCYAVIGRGGMQFKKAPKPNLETTGTKLSMTLREDINYDKLVEKICECALTSGVKTYLELKCENRVNEFSSGLHTLKQKSYKEIFKDSDNRPDAHYSYLKSSVENKDYEIHLSVSVDRNGNMPNHRNKQFFLINSPIEAEIDQGDTQSKYYDSDEDSDKDYDTLKKNYESYKVSRIDDINFDSLIVNMKNEDMFEAMGDRESATKPTEAKLREIIIDLYNETLKKIKPCHELKSWFNHPNKNFISSDNPDITKLIDQKSKTIQKLLNTKVFEYSDGKIKYDEKYLKNIIENAEKYFFVHKKDNRVKNLLDDNFDNYLVLVHPDKDPFNKQEVYDETIKTLEFFNFVEAKQYLKDNNIKAKRSNIGIQKEKGDITIHCSRTYNDYWSSGIRTSSETVQIDSDGFRNLKNKIIQVDNFSFYRDLLKMQKSGIYITTEKKQLKGIVKTLDEFQEDCNKKIFKTNYGDLNGDAIIRHSKTISLDRNVASTGQINKIILNPYEKEDKKQFDEQLKGLPYIGKSQLYVFSQDLDELYILALLICKAKNSNDHEQFIEFKREHIIEFYYNKLTNLEHSLKISENIKRNDFDSVFDYEKFLFKIRDFEMQLTDPIIKKFVGKVITVENFDEIKTDALTLIEKTKMPKQIIKNRQREYL